MKHDLFPQHWLDNKLLDDGFILQKTHALAASPQPRPLDAWLAARLNPHGSFPRWGEGRDGGQRSPLKHRS